MHTCPCAYPLQCASTAPAAGELCEAHFTVIRQLGITVLDPEGINRLLEMEAAQACPSRHYENDCRPCTAGRLLEARRGKLSVAQHG